MNSKTNISKNMVDERFECLSVVFRLAGSPDYDCLSTDYQREVAEKFAEFREHPAVKLAESFDNIAHDAVFKFAVHIEKKDGKFVFIEDIKSLFDEGIWNDEDGNGRWNETVAKKFLQLFNDFYVDTNYAEYFNSKITFFEEATQTLINGFYGSVNFEWFAKYVDISNLRCIYSPSSGNYGATVNEKIIYCCVFFSRDISMIHEYCHNFANKIAEKWYIEKQEFKELCDRSVNLEKMPYYGCGELMAYEYVTRAYTILYFTENTCHGFSQEELFLDDEKGGFPDIRKVYDMVLGLEQ